MARARTAAMVAIVLILLLGATALATPGGDVGTAPSAQAAVAWPPSSGLLVAEVVTGGASASDEYVEITNASAAAIDLAGLEVAYATSSGSTVTRKASWTTTLLLEPGRHLLVANGSGVFAASADGTYAGGFAATGGAIVLRPIGGQPIDTVAWGDATSGFLEGTAAPAPAAGSSIERRPGGASGNTSDTNDNAADFVVNASPIAQNLASPAVPGPGPSPSPSASAVPTLAPSPTAGPSASPMPAPTATPVPTPTATPGPTPTPLPTPSPTPISTPSPAPTASPTPSPIVSPPTAASPTATPIASPTPTPSPETIPASVEAVRALPDGTLATVEGVLTTDLGALESGRSGFVQDGTGGIAVYLDAAFEPPIPAASRIVATGIVDSRFGQRTLRVDRASLVVLGEQWLPTPLEVQTGAASEPLEGMRLQLAGTVTEAPTALSDGLGLMIDDGSGEIRIIVSPLALDAASPGRGSVIVARGPLGQRDSSGTGVTGYRLHATLAGDLEVLPPPSPSPTASPTPMPTPTATPAASESAAPSPAPSPTPSLSPTPSPVATPAPSASIAPVAIAEARQVPVGRSVDVRAVVIAEAGRLGTPPLLAIGDATGGIPVRLPAGAAAPARGTLIEVHGAIADPYGQTEIRPLSGGFVVVGAGTAPPPLALTTGAVGESSEGRLARVVGTVETSASKSSSNDITFSIKGSDGVVLRVFADASASLDPGLFRKGTVATFAGVIGQRASRKGAADGYRLWLRDRGDVAITTTPAPSPSPTPRGGPTPKPSARTPHPNATSVRNALLRQGQAVTVEGSLTVPTSLLDGSGRRTIIEDGTAAIELYLAAPDASLRVGTRVRATGTVGVAWGAPRLRAEEVHVIGSRKPVVHGLKTAPTAAVEWRLVKVGGEVIDVKRNGDRWTAELRVGSGRILVSGLATSGIASTDLIEGREATITGIVKRPYPTATDRRFAIVPRQRTDIVLGKASPGAPASAAPSAAVSQGADAAPGASGGRDDPAGAVAAAPDIDLRDLEAHVGERVRVGGLVTSIEADQIRLDDGTAESPILLGGDAVDLLAILQVGDALNAVGTPEVRAEPVLVVAAADEIELVGDLGGTEIGSPDATDGAAAAGPSAGPDASPSPIKAVLVPGLGLDSLSTGFGTLLLLGLASVAVTVARRQRAQRLLRSRIVARLEALAVGRGAPGSTPASGPDPAPDPPFEPQSPPKLGPNVRGSA